MYRKKVILFLFFGVLSGAISSPPRPRTFVLEGRVLKVGVMDSELAGVSPHFPLYFLLVGKVKSYRTLFSREPLSLSLYGKTVTVEVEPRGKRGRLWLRKLEGGVSHESGSCKAP